MSIKKLLSFDEVLYKTKDEARYLLLGNGFSMAYEKERFSFTNLLDSAIRKGIIEKDSPSHKLFDEFGTSDFEMIIKQLESSSLVLKYYQDVSLDTIEKINLDAKLLKEHLVEIVTNNHPETPNDIPEDEYINCINLIKQFDSIFTLNYDLLLLWTTMKYMELKTQDEQLPQKDRKILDDNCILIVNDGFGNTPTTVGEDYVIFKNDGSNYYQTIHFLHGGLHIFDNKHEIIKNTYCRTHKRLKDQTLDNLNKSIYPIFISEGTTNKKLARIIHNSYLNNSYKTLKTLPHKIKKDVYKNTSMIIFGTMLKNNDFHIIDAIVKNKIQNIYIGISDISKISEFAFLESQLSGRRKLHYYDYKTVKVWR